MGIKFIADCPVAYISELNSLVIAELHIGLEYELYKSGIFIPSQADKFLKTLKPILQSTKADTVIILGDLKHKVPGSTIREDKEIPRFLTELMKISKVILVKGNHDDRIEQIIPDGVKLYSSKGFKKGKYGFFHGHAWPSVRLMDCDYLFMGHIHPAVEFKDKFGYRIQEHVWLKGSLNQKKIKEKFKIKETGKLDTFIVPTFNNILGGIAMNKLEKERHIGPLLVNNLFDVNRAEAYLLDGTHLGMLKNLKK